MKKLSLLLLVVVLVVTSAFVLAACKPKDPAVDPVKYQLSDSAITLKVGEQKTLTLSPDSEKRVIWESSDASIATVSDGVVSAVAKGTSSISCKIDGIDEALTCVVTVEEKEPVTPVDYQLSDSEISLKVGEQKTVSVSPSPEGSVVWESSDANVATVSDGVVSAIAKGTATISCKIDGVDEALTCVVTVNEVHEYSLEISSFSIKTGETKQIVVVDKNGDNANGATYESNDAQIASVSEEGVITGVAKGSTIIKVTIEDQVLECGVEVSQKYSYSFDKESLDLAVGAIDTLTLIRTPDDEAEVRPHIYTSSDESVAMVNGGNGKVTAIGKGNAIITCLVDGIEVKAAVTVTEYVIKIGDNVMGDETILRIGTEQDIDISADPEREINAEYSSNDESVVTVVGGHIVPIKEGEAIISIKLGGKEFTTKAIVQAAITYSINFREKTVAIGETLQLEVSSNPISDFNVSYSSSDSGVASVSENGLVTANKTGTATITALVGEGISFEVKINAVLGSSISHTDYDFRSGSVNLTYLDSNKTLDWRRYNNGDSGSLRMKDNQALIGDYVGNKGGDFWDYLAPIVYEDGEGSKSAASFTYGINFQNQFSIPVTINNSVSKIVIMTGAWNRSGSIEFKLGDVVLQSDNFEGGSPALSRKYEFTIDTSSLADGESYVIDAVLSVLDGDGNVSLVAVTVVGKEAHDSSNASASVNISTPNGVQDLSTIGNVDWLAANGAHKANVPDNAGILRNDIQCVGGTGYANDYKDASFTWSDGNQQAPSNLRDIAWCDLYINIPVMLDSGRSTITVYGTGYIGGYIVALYDNKGVYVNGWQIADEHSESVTCKAVIDVDALEGGVYTVRILKCRGGGNIGWGAIALSRESDYSLEQNVYSAVVGGESVKINMLKDGVAVAEGISFSSDNENVATVSAEGVITAVSKGSAYITATVDGVNYYALVNVIEYKLTSESTLELTLGQSSQIVIDPSSSASYVSSDPQIASVSDSGLVTAVASGDAVITVTVQGVEFKINVSVAGYSLSETEIRLYLSADQDISRKTLYVKDSKGNDISDVNYISSNDDVAVVDSSNGVITAKGLGEATITASVGTQSFTCKVVVSMSSELEYVELNMDFENLSRVSDEYKTIDYKHWNSDGTVVMANRVELIGEPSSVTGNFWDYKTTIGYDYQDGGRNLGMCYGVTSGGFTLPVIINNSVSEIVFYTGAYQGTATVSFKLGDLVLGTKSFVADEGVARKLAISIDTTALVGDHTLDIVGSFENAGNGNIMIVAVAVVGKVPYSAMASGSVTTQKIEGDKGSNKVDLTEVGTLDWIYAHYENPNDKTYQKANGNVFVSETYYNGAGEAANCGNEWDGFSAFKWSDGILTDSGATEGSVNPSDSNEGWEGSGEYTNNYNTAGGEIHIKMHLGVGKYKISVYMNSWGADIATAIYDGNNNFVTGKIMINYEPDGGSGWVATYTLDVKEEGDFNLLIGKSRSHGANDRQVGWQAVAISSIEE